MTVAYVTFPGTSGNYVSTAAVNLLDADTAHKYQSCGIWEEAANCAVAATPAADTGDGVPVGGKSLSVTINAASVSGYVRTLFPAGGGTVNAPASPATEYSSGTWVYVPQEAIDVSIALTANHYWVSNVGAYLGEQAGTLTSPSTPGWVFLSVTSTSPANTAHIAVGVNWVTGAAAGDEVLRLGASVARAGADATFVPSLRIVGDLDMRARFAATDATPASAEALIGQRSGNSGYAMTLGTGGELVVYHGTGSGTRQETSSGLSLVAATATEVQSTLDISAGTWTHYKNGVQFDSSGSFATTAGSPYAGPLAVGADSAGTSGNWDGDIYYCEVRDGIDGPVVRRFDADDLIGLI